MESTFSAIEEAALIASAYHSGEQSRTRSSRLASVRVHHHSRPGGALHLDAQEDRRDVALPRRSISCFVVDGVAGVYQLQLLSHTRPRTCSMYVKAQTALQVAQYIVWAAFSGLRALALSGMNWTLASIVFLLACAPFAVNLWVISGIGTFAYNLPLAGCLVGTNETASQAKIGARLLRDTHCDLPDGRN
ncbi:hypothetical protein PYCCODRAFT_1291817 [Trametes coccinea BRFM310]|uniref:Uncharacterized protein n=1 Tax=Trametes coccinea (strain BRFM310) TaxID=1353009 RepID=A0A1Y2IWU5_TRAC3|nr:hypothetical protein PYCCODRAFT_1291817 [Trametes coccinea BRFM310]